MLLGGGGAERAGEIRGAWTASHMPWGARGGGFGARGCGVVAADLTRRQIEQPFRASARRGHALGGYHTQDRCVWTCLHPKTK